MKVAAVQFAPRWKDFSTNLTSVEKLAGVAAGAGASLVVFPELCLSGYSFLSEAEARPFAETLTGESVVKRAKGDIPEASVARLRALATSLEIAIVWGLIEEDPGTGDLYNTQMIALPTGEWTSYRKVNLWGNDHLWAKAGAASPPIISFMGKNIGLLICADVRDSSDRIDEFYEPGDADVVCFSANWGKGGFPAGKWIKFAQSNACHLILANRYGIEENNDFGSGGICVIDPSGHVNCEGLKWSEPCIVFGSV